MPVSKALKAVGAALAVIALCLPLMFLPPEDAQTAAKGLSEVTVTVPPTVMVATTSTTTDYSGEPTSTTTTTEPVIRITIAAAGDVLPHMPIVDSVKDAETGEYDFSPVFAPIAPYLARADYTVVNLEARLAGPEAGYSGYPLFNSPAELASALDIAGVDLVATANNHSLDYGSQGIVSTLDQLDEAGLAHVGTYRSAEERATPFVVNIDGVKVAFLNYTSWLNGFALPEGQEDYAVNVVDADVVTADAITARAWGADLVIALLHYGDEYERQPSEAQIETTSEILACGVDVILGSHPHVVQPILHRLEPSRWKDTDKYAAYSLGNLLSTQLWPDSDTDNGLIAYVNIEKRGLHAYVTGISYLPVYMQCSIGQTPAKYRVLPVLRGSEPESDVPLTERDKQRMAEVWEELRDVVGRPDENILPLDPADLGL